MNYFIAFNNGRIVIFILERNDGCLGTFKLFSQIYLLFKNVMKVKFSLMLKQFWAERNRLVLEVKVLIPKALEQV
jgi:hypothetical protein